jgi:hypothetical protein
MYKPGARVIVVEPPSRFRDDNGRTMPLLASGTVVGGEYNLVEIILDNGFTADGDNTWPMFKTEIKLLEGE